MSAITTHILDTSIGKPAAQVPVVLDFLDDGDWQRVGKGQTDADGRVKTLIPTEREFVPGIYRLEFRVTDYFEAQGVKNFYPYNLTCANKTLSNIYVLTTWCRIS